MLLTGLMVGILLIASGCAGQPATTTSQKSAANAGSASSLVSAKGTTGQAEYKGIPVSITKDGNSQMGKLDAPVTIEEYSDFQCPFCARHFSQTLPDLMDKYIKTGKVSYVFVDMPLAALHPTSHLGHDAARCVAEQGAARFWTIHDTLFTNQEQWRSLPDPSAYLADAAKQTGVDMSKYTQCLSSGRAETAVQKSVAAGEALGFNGTPTFRFIAKKDGKTYTLSGAYPVDTYHQWIDQLLAGKAPAQDQPDPAATAKPAEMPLWASAKGLAPDPDRAGFTLAGDPYKGNPQAPVTVVEFSDFQCPACQKHNLDIQPAIDKALVDTGKILWVFKNLPLKEHPQAPAAAAAAECAGKQGKFWQMHDLLFSSQASWAVDNPDPALLKLAGDLNLDAAQFTACYNSRSALETILRDVQDSQGVTTTTPTFIVLSGGKGSILNGSRPADQFISILQKVIDTASTGK